MTDADVTDVAGINVSFIYDCGFYSTVSYSPGCLVLSSWSPHPTCTAAAADLLGLTRMIVITGFYFFSIMSTEVLRKESIASRKPCTLLLLRMI